MKVPLKILLLLLNLVCCFWKIYCLSNIHILGSKFAQAEATKLNPYAALCNAMLKRMMGDLNGQCDSTKNG